MTISRRESDQSSRRVEKLLRRMSLQDKIGQMSQIDLSLLWKEGQEGQIMDDDKMIHYFGELGIGSLLNCAERWDAKRYRENHDSHP